MKRYYLGDAIGVLVALAGCLPVFPEKLTNVEPSYHPSGDDSVVIGRLKVTTHGFRLTGGANWDASQFVELVAEQGPAGVTTIATPDLFVISVPQGSYQFRINREGNVPVGGVTELFPPDFRDKAHHYARFYPKKGRGMCIGTIELRLFIGQGVRVDGDFDVADDCDELVKQARLRVPGLPSNVEALIAVPGDER